MAAPGGPLRVEVPSIDTLFDEETQPRFPHTGKMMDDRLQLFLENLARERRKQKSLEVEVAVRGPSVGAESEGRARDQMHAFFACEKVNADLDLKVNQVEGWGSFRYGIPLIALALVFAGVFYFIVPATADSALEAFIGAFLYLLFITVVWVMLWDPIEKLLFVAYFLKTRQHALAKLSVAPVRFVYTGGASAGSG